MKLYVPFLLSLALVMSGCSTTLKPRTLDATTGQFRTATKLSADSVKVNKPFVEKYRALAYVKTDDSKAKQYNDFFVESLKNMGAFNRVVTKQELEMTVLELKLTDKVSNISGRSQPIDATRA